MEKKDVTRNVIGGVSTIADFHIIKRRWKSRNRSIEKENSFPGTGTINGCTAQAKQECRTQVYFCRITLYFQRL
jgi:hypothetical protein